MSAIGWLPDVLADAFRGVAGYRVEAYAGHATRAARTKSFAPIGVLDHHTGSASTYDQILAYMATGSPIAPLCHVATSPPSAGVVRITVVASGGRANHAGAGIYTPAGIGRDQGNYRLIGIEHHNDGRSPWTGQQIEAARRIDAALLAKLGRRPDPYLLDHQTYAPTRKVDRHTLTLADERAAVAALLDGTTGAALMPAPGEPPVLLRIGRTDPVYEVRDGATIEHIPSAQDAASRHGPAWHDKVVTLTEVRLMRFGRQDRVWAAVAGADGGWLLAVTTDHTAAQLAGPQWRDRVTTVDRLPV